MVMYREVCPEGVQNKCPGGVWCRGFMSWGDTLILVISKGVQLYYGIAHCEPIFSDEELTIPFKRLSYIGNHIEAVILPF